MTTAGPTAGQDARPWPLATTSDVEPRPHPLAALGHRLLRLSLFAKILIANCAIVALGATAGTYVTAVYVRRAAGVPAGAATGPNEYAIMAAFAAIGLTLSLVVNALVLRTALAPLVRLERTAQRVQSGDLQARAHLGAIGDPYTDRLAETFNAMLDSLSARTRQIEASSARLQELSDQVLLAQEEERRRIARELHDDVGQVLSTLLLHLRLFRDAAAQPQAESTALATQAAQAAELAREVLDGIRRLALELRPRMLDDLGLVPALRAYVEEWTARWHIPVTFEPDLPADYPLSNATRIAVYRMVQEALTNVARHAAATRASVSLAVEDDSLVVQVKDNGRGFSLEGDGPAAVRRDGSARDVPVETGDPAAATDESAEAEGLRAGLGLFGMQERIALAGGTLDVVSAPGHGTTIRATLPRPAVAVP